MSFLSIDEAKKLDWFFDYGNGVYEYIAEDRFFHLIINNKDVLKGLGATFCYYYGDGAYEYITEDRFWHEGRVDLKPVMEGRTA